MKNSVFKCIKIKFVLLHSNLSMTLLLVPDDTLPCVCLLKTIHTHLIWTNVSRLLVALWEHVQSSKVF